MRDSILADGFTEQPWWWDHAEPSTHPFAEYPARADVVVVGSGYAGLSCALTLAQGGQSVIVVDAEKCGYGASCRNAGFLSGRAGVSKQINLEALVGKAHANRIFDEADAAYDLLKHLVSSENIACNLEQVGRFVGAHTPTAYEKLAEKMREYNSGGSNCFRMVSKGEQHQYVASDYWHGGMYVENAGTIHPSRYHRGLLELCLQAGVTIISQNRVLGIFSDSTEKRVETVNGTLLTREVVVATNGYTDALSPWHQKRLIPISSTLVASEELDEEKVAALLPKKCPVIDTKRVICLARPAPDGKRILFGGRGRFSPLPAGESAQILHRQLIEMFPQMHDVKVTNAWSGYMAFTFDFMPKIGVHDGIHYAVGCNGGCGIVMMSWLGTKVAHKILGADKPASALEGLEYKRQLFYSGKPWFLPVIGNWWRFRDWIDLQRVRLANENG